MLTAYDKHRIADALWVLSNYKESIQAELQYSEDYSWEMYDWVCAIEYLAERFNKEDEF